MLIIEQNLAQEQKIKKYKTEGYTELNLAAWQKRKRGDPNGTFVNVETYYYGYKPSNQQSSAENKKNENSPKKEQCSDTPFKNSTEGDAFRTWLLKNYPDYEKKERPYNVNKAPQPKYTNTTALRCAYKDKGKEYEAFLSNKPEEKKSPEEVKKDVEKRTQEYETNKQLYLDQLCSPWEDENNFEEEFSGQENEMAKDFVDFIYRRNRFTQFKDDKSYRVGDPVQRALKKYAMCDKKHDEYTSENITHKSPWLRDYLTVS